MTHDQWCGLVLIGIIIAISMVWDRFKRKKRPEFFIVDIVDVWVQTPKKRKSGWVANVLFLIFVGLVIWAGNG